jgi:hypothetical protein
MKKVDINGRQFSKLTVIESSEKIGKRTAWKCLCECGAYTFVTTDRLVSGKTTSCGCRKKQAGVENGRNNKKHGLTQSGAWISWASMKFRCTNKATRYQAWSGMLCKEWEEFENFYRDMGDRPDGTSIDRIDVTKGYYKENCRWATSRQQQNNKTNTRYLNVNGIKISLMDYAEVLGLKKTEAQYFFTTLKKIQHTDDKVNLWIG